WTYNGLSHTASARNIRGEFDSLSWTTSTIEITAVPEPTTGILVAAAFAALVATRRNRRG
ncbi:MAG: PEP-CTERM sorting domain-containing protein, partial [Planctomycetaceae bacterium]|nr:PEP-CTERM sorting domain-containing protein [Planctomycetaceae bacterium]